MTALPLLTRVILSPFDNAVRNEHKAVQIVAKTKVKRTRSAEGANIDDISQGTIKERIVAKDMGATTSFTNKIIENPNNLLIRISRTICTTIYTPM